ncbi:hypothetical protein J2X85_002250 [Microbacterium trichothecenolyticum]|uniref:hypothetical protein n=1 Tax=Microbacterium trichothecenolyticum TaxID=69370 RepID=UPI0028606DB2|nr:hypothetical protein [Microbacterium trichothecenolyticum]MDR7185216.1 hypothetical protein [Microbacterium trichothecenolyticum]
MNSTFGTGAGEQPRSHTGNRQRIDIDSQRARRIDNVTGDKYDHSQNDYSQYVQFIERERDSFLREVASTRTKARWLVWLGLTGIVVGFGIMLWIFAGYFDAFADIFRHIDDPAAAQQAFQTAIEVSFGLKLVGVNAIVLSLGLSTIGGIMLVVGIVLHVVATARRKRVDRDLVVPPPWQFPRQ